MNNFHRIVCEAHLYGAILRSCQIIGVTYVPKCMTLQWRHNDSDGVSNHQPHDSSLHRLFRCRSKKTSKLRVTGLCAGNSPVTGEFPAQRPVTQKMFPFDDVIMKYTSVPIALHYIRRMVYNCCCNYFNYVSIKHLTDEGQNKMAPYADDSYHCIFFNKNLLILIDVSLKFVRKDPSNTIPALARIMV